MTDFKSKIGEIFTDRDWDSHNFYVRIQPSEYFMLYGFDLENGQTDRDKQKELLADILKRIWFNKPADWISGLIASIHKNSTADRRMVDAFIPLPVVDAFHRFQQFLLLSSLSEIGYIASISIEPAPELIDD